MKTWVSNFKNRYEIKLLGVSRSPCVKRFCGPQRAFESVQTTNPKTISRMFQSFNYCVQMSENPHRKRSECQDWGVG